MGRNVTGHALRVPGGTLTYYPAFWVRDAAMMLGAGFVGAAELEGWIRVIAATQPGPEGLRFGKLTIPPWSIPDHITLRGEACWFPGAYAEQGTGVYGFLPPADDAYFFIQMVFEHWRMARSGSFLRTPVRTAWGDPPLWDVCCLAFESVEADPDSGLVICRAAEGQTRVDWGFCDAIRKSGMCLMPSLLRWRAAREMAVLARAVGDRLQGKRFQAAALRIQASIPPKFRVESGGTKSRRNSLLMSATELGRKDDLWAAAFAVWLGVLPPALEQEVARHLLEMFETGGVAVEGQIRHMPASGPWGGHWEQGLCPAEEYQNGGYWATPTGWYVTALRRVNKQAGDRLLSQYVDHLRAHRHEGAPWEWIQPARGKRVNPLYGSSAGLVYRSLAADRGF